jgi:ubiquinone/menaquinone biosynthesis C-methylase UbiE
MGPELPATVVKWLVECGFFAGRAWHCGIEDGRKMTSEAHSDLIRDQFTRQATPFSTASSIADPGALNMIVAAAAPEPDDLVLDVACGGGLVVCAFAPHVRHATGIDMTPAMLDHAAGLAAEKGIANVAWREGDVASLPWPDASFTIVVTRFAVHHFPDPAAVLREMVRVCAPGGRIVVLDTVASADPAKAAAFNRLEKLRDPSHVRALPLDELRGLFQISGLGEPEIGFSELRDEVKNLLARSFPNPGDDAKIAAMFAASVEDDSLGIPVHRDGDRLEYAYPTAILAARRN